MYIFSTNQGCYLYYSKLHFFLTYIWLQLPFFPSFIFYVKSTTRPQAEQKTTADETFNIQIQLSNRHSRSGWTNYGPWAILPLPLTVAQM